MTTARAPGRLDGRWAARFAKLAYSISEWSKDPSTKVGAVIVAPDEKRIMTTGYNGLPRGVDDRAERLADRPFKIAATVHAEANALIHAARQGVDVKGCAMFVTMSPCASCAALIIQSGISEVYAPDDPWPERWRASFSLGRDILLEAGVEYMLHRPMSGRGAEEESIYAVRSIAAEDFGR